MPYLAMTAVEFRCCLNLPEKQAWMACHFSPGGSGLTNLPKTLQPGSLLILDDSTPIQDHEPARVCAQLADVVQKLDCCGVLLDFEREPEAESLAMIEKILELPCPVCVAAEYGKNLTCPVFLQPLSPLITPEEDLRPWAGREIWLDCSPMATAVTVTKTGSRTAPLAPGTIPECPHFDEELLCHYRLDMEANQAVFTLCRTREDLSLLLNAAQKWGVTQGVGLWQELRP